METVEDTRFAGLAERYRGELRVHCYRMLGSFEDAEDVVQETFLRAWRGRETYAGRSTFRAWLYRIATNACLDFLDRKPPSRRQATASTAPTAITWLQPYPDELLDRVVSDEDGPDAKFVAKETIELAFLAAIQHLPSRQRAVLILRDVLGWPAKDTAELLESSVASVNSLLQRARPVLREHLPQQRLEWAPENAPSGDERAVLRRYMAAIEHHDDVAIAAVLREDARCGQQPGAGGHEGVEPALTLGREAIIAGWAPALHGPDAVEFRFRPVHVNRQPAAATYIRPSGSDDAFQPFALAVLTIDGNVVTDISVFGTDLFPAFGLPAALPA
jgi:RNA polymerase sigma-70 factor (ECF subfamily)